jgi:hypothetical protein
VYLDDILVFLKIEEEHVDYVKEVLGRLKELRLYVRLDKCEWHTSRIEYLGYIVLLEGLTIDLERVKII